MVARLEHRGPDGRGVWVQEGLALGHARLAILDLSAAGAQPMASATRRWTVSFNGEIFNHLELRRELSGYPFQGHSDTETLLAALETWGWEATLPRLVGMFALAAWDAHEGLLYLGRDRAGQKPLFYGFFRDHLVFGSELTVLEALPERPALDLESMALMLRYNSIPAPRTVYRDMLKLPPATWVRLHPATWRLTKPSAYWSPRSVAGEREGCPLDQARRLLEQAVSQRMLSDVPLGAFLSGGLDSSLVVSVMQRLSSQPVRTFTIAFDDPRFSEAAQARAVARHLGTEHTECTVTATQARALVPQLGAWCDEPFGDSSLLPTLLLSEMTRRSVTVALTGDGGDELFGGYHRQIWLPRLARGLRHLPTWLRRQLGSWMISPSRRAPLLTLIAATRLPLRLPEDKLSKLGHLVLEGGKLASLYRASLSHARHPEALIGAPVRGYVDEMAAVPPGLQPLDQVCLADFTFYLPTDVLVKVDRASMRYGLEARSPLLDHRLVEFAFSLEASQKVRSGRGKWLLRQLLAESLPAELMGAPKMGFAVPIADWLRHDLRDWVEDLLASRWTGPQGLLRRRTVQEIWRSHLAGRDRHAELWNLLMLLSWLEAHASS